MGVRAFLALLFALATPPALAECQFLKVGSPAAIVDGNRLYLPGTVNGRDILFLVDTGSQTTLILAETGADLGLEAVTAPGRTAGISGRSSQLYRARIHSLKIGNWEWRDVDLLLSGRENTARRGKPVILLGADFLSRFDIELDLNQGVVNLFTPQDCDGAKLAYWAERYNAADMVASPTDSGHILLKPRINGTEITAMLDTGAGFTALSKEAASRIAGIGPDSPGVTQGGQVRGVTAGTEDSWLASFDEFKLDEESIKPAKLRFFEFQRGEDHTRGFDIRRTREEFDMLLGFDFIHAHHVLISNSQHKVYFTYSAGAPFQKVWPRAAEQEAPVAAH